MTGRLAAAILAPALVAGCGGPSHPQARGQAIYERSCSSCHTVSGHERGSSGGDLALLRMSVTDLASFTRVMPVDPPLSRADAEAVARYLHGLETRRHG